MKITITAKPQSQRRRRSVRPTQPWQRALPVDFLNGHTSQTRIREGESILIMTPEALARTIEDFLAGARDAIVLDDGAAMFDLAQARYSVSGERNKCLLHLWSDERNMVRRVLDVEIKHEVLRLAVQRLGQTRPSKLEICRQRDRRTPTAKRAARAAYQRSLQRTLERRFPTYRGLSPDYFSGSGAIVRSDLCSRATAPRTVRLRGAGRESAGDPVLDRCRSDFRNPVARCLPPGTGGKNNGGRSEVVLAGGDLRAGPRAHGTSAP